MLEKTFTGHMRALLVSAPVVHAEQTTGRAAGALSYEHLACTQYLTLMHVGGHRKADVDAEGLTDFAVVCSYLDTATKWGKDKLDAVTELFTTGAWLPPTHTPAHAA